ncbi:competence/damage-inducible protein A [Lachnospiraceae bacterium NSJ-143]|nr:competence/damage-inducible protein A [Lachnospiraceae bacterium NSJ-143]
MKAEIIAVGTELLLGDILNTNAQYLSKQLSALGIEMYYQSVVGDNSARLKEMLKEAFSRSDLVITSGGLGPTEDDLTKETGCEYFGKKLVEDKKALEMLKEFFSRLNREMTENNYKQALVPEGSIVLYNENGTAPGIMIDDGGKILVMFPGPPKELIPMFEKYVRPYLASKQEYTFVSRVLRVSKLGESMTEHLLRDLIDSQTNPTIATYVKNIEVVVRITAKAKSESEANKLIDPVASKVYERLGNNVYAEGETTISEVVCRMLMEKKITVAVSESCTGGLLSAAFTDIPGISEVFAEGAVTYSNEAKMRRLGVKSETLEKYGAVSAQTAAEMAEGIAKTAGTDIGLSTTGIAGPGGGTEEKPVGLVYIGLCVKGRTVTKELHFTGNREKIRVRTVDAVFDALRRELENMEQNS